MSRPEALNIRRILLLWLPLAASWLVMNLEMPSMQILISRHFDVTVNLAAFGVACSLVYLIESFKKQARSIRSHKQLILNWFRVKKLFSAGIVEGLNCKAKLTMRKAYGFPTFKGLEIALYHQLGDLPEPKLAHRFF